MSCPKLKLYMLPLNERKNIITVINKIDKTLPGAIEKLKELFPGSIAISALKREGFDELVEKIMRQIEPKNS